MEKHVDNVAKVNEMLGFYFEDTLTSVRPP